MARKLLHLPFVAHRLSPNSLHTPSTPPESCTCPRCSRRSSRSPEPSLSRRRWPRPSLPVAASTARPSPSPRRLPSWPRAWSPLARCPGSATARSKRIGRTLDETAPHRFAMRGCRYSPDGHADSFDASRPASCDETPCRTAMIGGGPTAGLAVARFLKSVARLPRKRVRKLADPCPRMCPKVLYLLSLRGCCGR